MHTTQKTVTFSSNALVRNRDNQILTVTNYADGKVFVEEESYAYDPTELEPVDQTNIIKFTPKYY
jgi:hypothetical protein